MDEFFLESCQDSDLQHTFDLPSFTDKDDMVRNKIEGYNYQLISRIFLVLLSIALT